ncbi:MAG TPA: ATP-binding protein [Oceanobacillus sp.]|nr:ATP-binding protein [Oceanobacillus sp.]
MFTSLRTRLTLLFVVLTVIPLVIVGTLIARRGFEALENQASEFQEQLARQTAISLGAFFNERRNELLTLTEVAGLTSLDEDAQRDALLTLLTRQPAYYQVAMLDADGQETIRLTRGELVRSDLVSRADDPLFQQAVETGSISFSPVHFNQSARDQLITIAVPVQNLFTGEVGNVLIAEVRFRNVEETVLRSLGLVEGEDVYVVDSEGVVIAHRNPNLVLRQTVFDLPETNGRYTGLGGDDVILAMDKIQLEGLELIVVAETTYANATTLAYDLSSLAAVITINSLLIAAAIVAFSVNRAVNPILKISKVAEAIEGGDLTVKADETGAKEVATLGRTFNRMTAQLSQTLKGLQEHVTQLEKANEERENLIKDLQAAKRLAEENSRLKSEFLSTMSHELRTPMNAIEGFSSIMLSRMGGVDYNDKAERYLTKVQSNSQRLLNLINDFLDLSRIESGRLELAHLPITLADMVQKWRDELGVVLEKKDVAFEVFIDPNLPETIYGDEEALSKVATNLLGNAFKFTHQGKVSLRLERRDQQMALQVSDTGIGIPPHAREFIFDEFRQVDQSSKRVYGGTGLGLAIVQKFVREMGGTVTLESEVGKGSTFTVLLPIQTEKVYA